MKAAMFTSPFVVCLLLLLFVKKEKKMKETKIASREKIDFFGKCLKNDFSG